MPIDAVITAERTLLERLEQFARSTKYARLLEAVVELMGKEGDPWSARPAFGFCGLPIDIASEPGGVDVLVDQLVRIAQSNCA